MRNFLAMLPLVLLASACTPPEDQYCAAVGTPPAGLAQCHAYYFSQDAAFRADLAVCSAEADRTYPPSLYSGWSTALVRYPSRTGFSHIEQVEVPPDAQRNAEVDALRGRIIEPCMQARGWNSGRTWQAGRHDVKPAPRSSPLPWHQ